MRDLRKCYRIPYDSYLFMDETGRSFKRDVLGRGSPGATHMHARTQMWKMEQSLVPQKKSSPKPPCSQHHALVRSGQSKDEQNVEEQ